MSYIGSLVDGKSVARMFQTADCYVSPYKAEGFNLPALEASACGLPVVVPRDGCTDSFLNDETAIRIPSAVADHYGDGHVWIKTQVDDIAAAMESAITDKTVTDRARIAGPLNAQRYTWDSVVHALLGVMTATLKGSA